ncbi:MAG: hypothetical protein ACPG8A_02700 [Psychrobium sp.]
MKQQASKRKNSQLILMILAFLIPVIAAKILLASNYKGDVKTNGGELLNMTSTFEQVAKSSSEAPKWQLLYLTNQACDEHCQQQLYFVTQTYRALGRLQERVNVGSLTLGSIKTDTENLQGIDFKQQLLKAPLETLEDSVVIVDPLGNFVMRYQLNGTKQQRLERSHDMLLDIKRLLKLSRIG